MTTTLRSGEVIVVSFGSSYPPGSPIHTSVSRVWWCAPGGEWKPGARSMLTTMTLAAVCDGVEEFEALLRLE